MRSHTTHTRDAALGKLRTVNRWIIAGSVALTAVLSDVAANAFPGKTIKSSQAKKRGSVKHSAGTSSTPAKPLAPPAQAPEASAPSQESAPQESAPAKEAQPSAPSQEAQQAAPAQETPQPAPEASPEPAPESSGPVVSGGS
jgi:2-oxoglutarate decarboxylase